MNRRLLAGRRARTAPRRVVRIREPEGDATFHWVLPGDELRFRPRPLRELLDAARAGGYRFAHFDRPPEPGDLLLRHDVDLSLDAALRLGELEARARRAATYFLMTESVFYNLASNEGTRAIARLRELGHRVGLHAVYPHAVLDERFDPVVAWHNPDPEYMAAPVDGAVNVMQPGFFDPPPTAPTPTSAGVPAVRTRSFAPALPWLQLLTHPEIWVYPGETMGQTMRAMLDAQRERRLGQLAEDRIDLA